jgi:hypothetical protein
MRKSSLAVFLAALLVMAAMNLTGSGCDNEPPVLDPIGTQEIVAGQPWTYELTAHDGNGDSLTFYAVGLPEGATLDPDSGLVAWQPDRFFLAPVDVLFGVTDGMDSDEEAVRIEVRADTDFTEIEIEPEWAGLVVGDQFRFQANGTREDGEYVEDIYVNWVSDDTTVATVDWIVNVTAVGAGTATIKGWLVFEEELFGEAQVDVSE